MDCFVGASTGALKGISFQDGVFHNLNAIGELNPKSDEITSMCWTNEHQTELLTVQLNRQLKLYDTVQNYTSPLFNVEGGNGTIKGIHMTKSKNVISAAESGEFRVWSESGEVISDMNAGNNLLVMVADVNEENRCATGGKENPLKIWDLEKGVKTFTAKNVAPDNLQLRVPVWENDIRFLNDLHGVISATGKCQLRLYDPRAQRRPVKELNWLDEPITALSLCHSPTQVLAGNTRGDMGLFDIRHKMSPVCKFKGFAGSVRGIAAHPHSPYVASCSIDRFVRLHDLNTKKLLKKVYCKVRLNRILMKDDLSLLNTDGSKEKELENYEKDWEKIEELDSEDTPASSSGSEEDEALWNDMKTVRDTEKRKHKEDLEEDSVSESMKKPKLASTKRKHGSESPVSSSRSNDSEQSKKPKIEELKRKHNSNEHVTSEGSESDEQIKRRKAKETKRQHSPSSPGDQIRKKKGRTKKQKRKWEETLK